MRAKYQRTLNDLFRKPTPSGIRWADIVAMLHAAGVEVTQRSGSRVLLKKGAERIGRIRNGKRGERRCVTSPRFSMA